MSSSREREFVLGTATFSVLAVETLLVFNKLLGLLLFQVIGVEPGSVGFRTMLISTTALLLVLTIALSAIATYVVLRKCS